MDAERSPSDARFRPNVEREIAKAWDLHQKGMSLREIAAELGDKCSVSTAKARVDAAKKEYDAAAATELDAERIRAATNLGRWQGWLEEAHRLQDENAARLTTKVVGGGLLQIQDRLAKLLGLDAPRRLGVHIEPEKADPRPNMAVLQAYAEELDQYEQESARIAATDGLGEYDS